MRITRDDVFKYRQDGFLLKENVFQDEEIKRLIQAIESGERVKSKIIERKDTSGKSAKLAYWEDIVDDIWSSVTISPRIVNGVRILMGEEISFFHGKVMLKEAHSGGAWEWHQDYGYWYDQGFIYPNMISVFVALDPSTKENGCLQVLKGSHHLNRLNHNTVGEQTGIDRARISYIKDFFSIHDCIMSPGSVLFFHCNLLHASSANESDHHRRSFIMCYSATNNPQLKDGKPVYRPICQVGDDKIG